MKKYRTLIAFLAVLAVLTGVYVVLIHSNRMRAEKDQDETIMVTELSKPVSMEYSDGETTLSFIKESDTWRLSNDAEKKLDNAAVESIANTLSQIEAERVLEGAEELSEYGLDEPAYTVKLKAETGEKVILYIGNANGEHYYATVADKGVIYMIDSAVVYSLKFDVTALEAEVKED